MARLKRSEANVLAKECIVTALIELMKTKPYEKISITEISDKAGVSRMAYYRNYNSKDEILDKYLDEELEKSSRSMRDAGRLRDFYIYFYEVFDRLGVHSDVGTALYYANQSELLLDKIDKSMLQTFPPEDPFGIDPYRRHLIAGAFYAVFMHWIVNGKRESCAQMADLCNRMLLITF